MIPTDTEQVKASEYLNQGNKHQQQGNIDQSIESYQKAIELNPNSIPALSKLAEIYKNQKEYATAFTHYLKIVSLRPKNATFLQNLVRLSLDYSKLLLKKNDLNKAIAAYEEFLNQKLPKNDQIDIIYDNLGEAILKLSVRQAQFRPGTTFFQQAIDKYPYKVWSYYHLGNILAKQGQIDESIACFDKAVEIRPEFPLGLLSLGRLLLRKGRRNKAFECGLKIIRTQGYFEEQRLNDILNQLLSINSNQKNLKEALQKAIGHLEISSSQRLKVTTYENIGTVLLNQGKLSEASDFYQKSLYYQLQKSNPEFVNRYWELGQLQEPDFLVIGFGKCGTTSFYQYLCQHPQVLPAIRKEPYFLPNLVTKDKVFEEKNWSFQAQKRDLYLAHFAPRTKERNFITGEASTGNIIPGVEKIIASWFPKIKLIVLLREPVKRTISHYEQRVKDNKIKGSLEEVINSELDELHGMTNPAKTTNEILKNRGWNANLAMSLYVYPLERWMNLFPREQFLILTDEDLAQYPAETMKQGFDFLGLPECNSINYKPRNVGSYPQIDENLLSRLSNFFRPHNQRLEEFLGRKFNWDENIQGEMMPTATEPVKASEYLSQGKQLRQEGKLEEAISATRQVLQLHPDHVPAHFQLAEIYESRKEFEKALTHYQHIVKLEPDHSVANAKLARVMLWQGNIGDAIANYQKAIALPQPPAFAYAGLADALKKNGQLEEAIAAYQKAIEIRPDKSIVHAQLAKAMMAQKNTQEAIAAYQKAIALQPEQPVWVYQNLGDALNQNRQIEEAIATYQKAIELNPNSIPALSKLAEIYINQKEYAQAFTYYLKIVSVGPKKAIFLQNLVRVSVDYCKLLLKKNDLNKAIAAYEEFLNQKLPRNANAEKIDIICNNLGEVILLLAGRQGKFSPGITFFQVAIDNSPYKVWSYYHLGNILAKQGKIDEAIACYEKTVEIRPKFYIGFLSLGRLLLQKGNRNEAFQCGLKILYNQGYFEYQKLNISDVQRLNNALTGLLSLNSDQKESQETLQKAIEQIEIPSSKPDLKVTTYYNIAKILLNQGKLSEAINLYQKSIYHRLQKSKPEFVNHYWEHGQLREPDFLVIGFGKCGTTAFYQYLCQHPQVLPAVRKEPFFLSNLVKKTKNFEEINWSLPSAEKDFYLAHFPPRPEGGHFITGEASTSNIFPGVEKIISSWCPKTKLIALLREPVKRTISHYEELLKKGIQNRSLEELISSELEELEATNNRVKTITEKLKRGWKEHIAMSLYVYSLERWMNLFPREQFLILTNENLARYPAETMKQAFNFLGLPECNSINYKPRNVGSYPQIDENLLSRLSNFFQPHNQRLEEFLGRKFNWD